MMKLIFSGIIVLSTLAGFWGFAKLHSHIISTLLSLEFASLSLYLMLFYSLSMSINDLYLGVIYLTLSACEGALGLSILVNLVKLNGNDYLQASNMTQC